MRAIPCKILAATLLAHMLIGGAVHADTNDDPFPRPAELQPDIRFWTKVYTQIDSSSGFLHDDRHLGVIYATLRFPTNLSKRKRRREIEREKQRYRKILLTLASGRRSGLNDEQRRVLQLWPEKVTNRGLRAAAQRLRFQLGQKDKFLAGLTRAGAWEDYIRRTLREQGLPEGLCALPHVESSYHPAAYSHRGASGLWQFTRSTGRRYMRVDRAVDERRDPFISTVAAARLLKHNHAATGTWPLAITAYNHGTSGVRRATRKIGTTDIAPIVRRYKSRRFGFASRNFYVAFLAALDVSRDATRYFGTFDRDPPSHNTTVKLDGYIAAERVAEQLRIPLAELREHNPALRKTVWKGLQRIPTGYRLRVPHDSINASDATRLLAQIDEHERHSAQQREREYVVERGNTLSTIAQQFGVSVSDLMEINDLRNAHFIRTGQTIRLPLPPTASIVTATVTAPPGLPVDGLYTVQSGDSISLLALRFGIDQTTLKNLNALNDIGRIEAGQTLIVSIAPGEEPQTTAEPLAAATPTAEESESELEEQQIAMVESGEPASQAEAHALGPAQPPAAHPSLSADPSDYSVADDGTIEVQIPETLGHYADWLDLSTQRLRDMNDLDFEQPVIMGKRLKLDFSRVGPSVFEDKRRAFHVALQEAFFSDYHIVGTRDHTVRAGDSLWLLAHYTYRVPIWLIRQYNPDLSFANVRPGTNVVVPLLETLPSGPQPQDSVEMTAG
jgi:membrane-bound lytic murein transglycosylase D